MKKIYKWLFMSMFVILTSFYFYGSINAAGQISTGSSTFEQGSTAADFTLKDLKGNDTTLSSFRGKKVLLVFGATWCPYCVEEIPQLNAFYERHLDNDVKILSIDIKESLVKVTNFAQKQKIKYTVLLDLEGKVANQYNVYGIPTNILIDENGLIEYRGSAPKDGFESLLAKK